MNNEMPLLPDLYMPICDVRMVAKAHMQAMLLNEAQNQRHIVTSASECFSMKDIAIILKNEFKQYNVPTSVGPNFLVHLFAIFDKTVKQVI